MRELFVQNDKRISVYDNLFELKFKQHILNFASSSLFQIGWEDKSINLNQNNKLLYSNYSQNDVENLGILDEVLKSEASHELEGFSVSRCILNLSTPSDYNYIHTHTEDKVLLYYVNLEWGDGWHGETMFYSEDYKDVVFTSPYTPGRLISFDASIPHTIRPQSNIAFKFRFTLSIFLEKT